jgi:hypothetical protein
LQEGEVHVLTRRERLRKVLKGARQRLRRYGEPTVPVFLFGEMRSGTNMLLDCFDASPDTEIFNETDDRAFEDYELRTPIQIEQLIASSPASHVVFKPTADGNVADVIMDRHAHSRGIWIYRNYVDAVNSATERWVQHNEYVRLILEEPEKARWRALNVSSTQMDMLRSHYSRKISEQSARALIWFLRNSFYFECGLDRRSDIQLVSYEHAVQSPERHVRRAFEHCGLRFEPPYTRKMFESSVGRLQKPEIDEAIEKLCLELLERFDSRLRARV